MPKKTSTPSEGALFVRLPAEAVEKLDRAAEMSGMRKKDLVAGLVSRYVDPDSPRGLSTLGSYSFQPYDPPEVMNAEQAGQFLQVDESVVVDMAEAGKLPGRKIGAAWRFSRAALVAWLSAPEKRER
jgi:excisionase family DNA binding protein